MPKPSLVRRIAELQIAKTPRAASSEAGTDQSGYVNVISTPRPTPPVVMILEPRGNVGSSGRPRNASHSNGASTQVPRRRFQIGDLLWTLLLGRGLRVREAPRRALVCGGICVGRDEHREIGPVHHQTP